jgi:hypothetical protein
VEQTDKAKNKQRPGTIAGLGILPPFLLTVAPVQMRDWQFLIKIVSLLFFNPYR